MKYKAKASAFMQIDEAIEVIAGRAISELFVFVLVLGLAVSVAFILKTRTPLDGLKVGASFLAMAMTGTPIGDVGGVPRTLEDLATTDSSANQSGALQTSSLLPILSRVDAPEHEPEQGAVTIILLPTNGRLPAEATIEIIGSASRRIAYRSTIERGRIDFFLGAGEYEIRIEASGFATIGRTLRVAAGKRAALLLQTAESRIPLVAQRLFTRRFEGTTSELSDTVPVFLTLDRIGVGQDGTIGSTEWGFMVLVGDIIAFKFPTSEFDDDANSARYLYSLDPSYSALLELPSGLSNRITILGYRAPAVFGSVSAAGTSVTVISPGGFGQGHFELGFVFADEVVAGRQGTNLKLRSLEVHEDGSIGETEWAFDVFADGRRVIHVPSRGYSDDAGVVDLEMEAFRAFVPAAEVSSRRGGSRQLDGLDVVGYRPPIVEGAGEILLDDLVVEGPMELIVPVANQDNARNGDFSFYFTISAPRLEPIKKQPVVVAR